MLVGIVFGNKNKNEKKGIRVPPARIIYTVSNPPDRRLRSFVGGGNYTCTYGKRQCDRIKFLIKRDWL